MSRTKRRQHDLQHHARLMMITIIYTCTNKITTHRDLTLSGLMRCNTSPSFPVGGCGGGSSGGGGAGGEEDSVAAVSVI